jgi:hypothetical protein
MALHGGARQRVAEIIKRTAAAWTETPSIGVMNDLTRLLCKWRSNALAQTYFAREGEAIYAGPFKGMAYLKGAAEGALIPRLLGVYENELHPHIERFAALGLDAVIDVGCAEGYYAVGLARLMRETTIYAHDISEAARESCAALAAKNEVAARVVIGGAFRPEDFEGFAGRRTMVMVDTEGAELAILDPARGPALKGMWIIVETHDGFTPGALQTLTDRFAGSHDIVRVDAQAKVFEMPWWLKELGHLDQLLAVWEWRTFPTPWLVMTPKSAA